MTSASHTMLTVEQLARAFAAALTAEVGDEVVRDIVRRNQRLVEGACDSHRYCDANLLMEGAFVQMLGRSSDPSSDIDARLWSMAWALARNSDFFAVDVARIRAAALDTLATLEEIAKSAETMASLRSCAESERAVFAGIADKANAAAAKAWGRS